MKAYLNTLLAGKVEQEIEKDIVILPPGGGQIRFDFDDNEQPPFIEVDGCLHDFKEPIIIPRLPNSQDYKDKKIIKIILNNKEHRYSITGFSGESLKKDLLIFLQGFQKKLGEISNNNLITLEDLIKNIEKGFLLFLATQDIDIDTGFTDKWCLEKIEKSLIFLQNVCNNPRKHLKVDEAIRPIEVVRRTGPAALRHIASHSEHWQARTVAGLKPIRLLAQLQEDDIAIYENRFVRSLIEKIYCYVKGIKNYVKSSFDNIGNALAIKDVVFTNYFSKDNIDSDVFKILLPTFNKEAFDKMYSSLNKYIHRIDYVIAIIGQCMHTTFYYSLIKHHPVTPPINPTNILLMDPFYKPLYDLWIELEKIENEIEKATDDNLNYEVINNAYFSFCLTMLISALVTFGFEPNYQQNIALNFNEKGQLIASGIFIKGEWIFEIKSFEDEFLISKIRISISKNIQKKIKIPDKFLDNFELVERQNLSKNINIVDRTMVLKGCPDSKEFKNLKNLHKQNQDLKKSFKKKRKKTNIEIEWEKFISEVETEIKNHPIKKKEIDLIPHLVGIGDSSTIIERNTKFMLNSALENTEKCEINSTIILIPTSLRSLPESLPPKIIRRLLNIGECYDGKKTCSIDSDAKKWGDWRCGILPISPYQVNSYWRFIRLFNVYTIGENIRDEIQSECPNCRSTGKSIKKDENKSICTNCNTKWGITTCPHEDCKNNFAWLSPTRGTEEEGRSSDYSSFIEISEIKAGKLALTGFCESEEVTSFSIIICPKCGKCSRYENNKEKCHRCKSP